MLRRLQINGRSFRMTRDNHQGASNNRGSVSKRPSEFSKEEISYELAELGNLKPKRGKMTPNQREKGQEEKTY